MKRRRKSGSAFRWTESFSFSVPLEEGTLLMNHHAIRCKSSQSSRIEASSLASGRTYYRTLSKRRRQPAYSKAPCGLCAFCSDMLFPSLFVIFSAVLGHTVPPPPCAPNMTTTPFSCPSFGMCTRRAFPFTTPIIVNAGPSGTVCVYTENNTNSCNVGPSGSFCSALGEYYGPDRVECDRSTGACRLINC